MKSWRIVESKMRILAFSALGALAVSLFLCLGALSYAAESGETYWVPVSDNTFRDGGRYILRTGNYYVDAPDGNTLRATASQEGNAIGINGNTYPNHLIAPPETAVFLCTEFGNGFLLQNEAVGRYLNGAELTSNRSQATPYSITNNGKLSCSKGYLYLSASWGYQLSFRMGNSGQGASFILYEELREQTVEPTEPETGPEPEIGAGVGTPPTDDSGSGSTVPNIQASKKIDALGSTLEAYIRRDSIAPYEERLTDADGIITFVLPSEGAYLVLGERFQNGEMICAPEPVFLCLPYEDETEGVVRQVTAELKYQEYPPGNDLISITVVKLWKDDGYRSYRPVSLTVDLFKDGNQVYSAELSESNGWRHTWINLDPSASWSVTERQIPLAYQALIRQEKQVFFITNTIVPGTPKDPEDPVLPNTGLVWWPVPALLLAGMGLLVIGVIIERKQNED